jgi:hypothetical protein
MIWGLGILVGFFCIIFLILSFILSRKRSVKRDGKIRFDWNRVLFVHASEEAVKGLELFLKNSGLEEIDYLTPRLKNGLYIYYREESDQDLLSQLKKDLKGMGFYVEEVSYEKVRKEEETLDNEWKALLGEGLFEIRPKISNRLYH